MKRLRNQRNKTYFQLVTTGNVADLNIYGDITSYPMGEGVSAANLSKQLAGLKNVQQINVYVNSYGGEVGEGLAIYNALKRHKAHVTTYCDGMACSIASVIFMAGDERIMANPSMLMIHDAWTGVEGNAAAFRKAADDLEVITAASVTAYMERINITEQELRQLMQDETWLTQDMAVKMGFATGIEGAKKNDKPAQSAKKRLIELLLAALAEEDEEEPENPDEEPETAPDEGETGEEPAEPADTGENEPENEDEPEQAEENPDEPGENVDDSENNNENSDETNENDDEPDVAAQKWSGFFNAIFGR